MCAASDKRGPLATLRKGGEEQPLSLLARAEEKNEGIYRDRQKGGPTCTVFELLLRQYSNLEENIY